MSSKFTIHRFEVEGSGTFPIDMLRHGRAWPATETDSYLITDERKARTVELEALNEPNKPRWSSFGWTVMYERVL